MDVRELQYVLKVAEEKSFSKAAQKLYIAQPSLSQYIMKIEEKLDVRLFDRSSVPLTLTYAGECFIESARSILDLTNQLQRQMSDISNLKNERIIIGVTPFRSRYFIPKVLPSFQKKYPGVEVIIKEDRPLALEQLILNGDIDLSFQILPIRNKGIVHTPVHEDELLLALSPLHAIIKTIKDRQSKTSSYPEIDLSELKDEIFVLPKTNFTGRSITTELFEKAGFSPKVLLETESMDTAHALAASGAAIAFVPESLIPYCNEKAVYFSIKNKQPIRTLSVLAYRANAYLSKATLAFFEVVKQEFN